MNKAILFSACIFLYSFLLKSQTVTVDFAQNDSVISMLGFIHGMSSTQPVDSSLQQLHPAYWRAGTLTDQIYSRATATLGSKYILATSDYYGYPQNNPGWIAPYSDTAYYNLFMDSVCASTSGINVIYQPWNEPDGSYFWTGTNLQFFETFVRAEHRIRQNLGGNVDVIGPSIELLDTTYIRNFCNYCLANNVQLDYLSWHWFFNDVYVYLIQDALNWANVQFVNNPAYSSLHIKGIIIDEMTSSTQHYQPAHYLSNLYYLEKGKASGAVHACWDALDGTGSSNCWNNTIDGLLTASKQPRSVWWAAKCYAETIDGRVESTSSTPEIISFAAVNEFYPDEANVLIAHYARIGYTPSLVVDLQLNNLSATGFIANGDSFTIIAYKIPDDSIAAITSLAVVTQQNYVYNGQSVSMSLPALPVKEAYWLSIKKNNQPSSIDKVTLDFNSFSIYPNPAANEITISTSLAIDFKIEIINLFGQIVLKTQNEHSINSSSLANGVYFVKIVSEAFTDVQKISIQK